MYDSLVRELSHVSSSMDVITLCLDYLVICKKHRLSYDSCPHCEPVGSVVSRLNFMEKYYEYRTKVKWVIHNSEQGDTLLYPQTPHVEDEIFIQHLRSFNIDRHQNQLYVKLIDKKVFIHPCNEIGYHLASQYDTKGAHLLKFGYAVGNSYLRLSGITKI